jgi:hypothetical protein
MSEKDKPVVHMWPVRCLLPLTEGIEVGTKLHFNKDINHVTCPDCLYYFFFPNARRLERQFREGK